MLNSTHPHINRSKSQAFHVVGTLVVVALAYVLQEWVVNRVILPLLIRASSGGWSLGMCGLRMLKPYVSNGINRCARLRTR
jgi:predicted RND superfamily exporter protein